MNLNIMSNDKNIEDVGLLYFKQACLFLNIKPSRMRYLLFTKKIPSERMGSTVIFFKDQLIEWIKNPNKKDFYE